MDGGSDDGADDNEDCQDDGESGNGQEGVQGSHHTHSRVLRARCTQRTDVTISAFLRAYAYPVEKLNAA